MNFKKRVLEANVYGEEVKISFPNVKQTQAYAKQLEKDESNATELLLNFLDKLGLPKELSEEMEAEHLTQLVEKLMPSKKK